MGFEFVIHVEQEYDYRYSTLEKFIHFTLLNIYVYFNFYIKLLLLSILTLSTLYNN